MSFIPWRKMLFQSIQPKIPPGQFPFAFTATLLCLLWSTAIYQGTQTSIQHFQPTANRWVSQDTWQWDEEVTISWHRVLIESRLNHWQWKRRTACGRKVCSEKAPLRHWSTHCSFCVACTSLFKVDKNTKVFKSHTRVSWAFWWLTLPHMCTQRIFKNNAGGISHRKVQPKQVVHHANIENLQWYLVYLYTKCLEHWPKVEKPEKTQRMLCGTQKNTGHNTLAKKCKVTQQSEQETATTNSLIPQASTTAHAGTCAVHSDQQYKVQKSFPKENKSM